MFIIIQTCWLVDGLAIREILSATILHTVNTTMCNMSVRKVFIRTKYVSSIIGTKLNFAIKLMKIISFELHMETIIILMLMIFTVLFCY